MSTSLRPLRLPNFTTPSRVANSVSSPPRETPMPGWNLVPRWRTRIDPAVTAVPSNAFTPRRWAFESLPLRVDPPPLVFDISLLALGRDARDLDGRVLLAMAPAATLAGLRLVGEPPGLGGLLLADHRRGDRRAPEGGPGQDL